MEIVRHRFSQMQASGWFSDEQEPLQEWIYISNIYGRIIFKNQSMFSAQFLLLSETTEAFSISALTVIFELLRLS